MEEKKAVSIKEAEEAGFDVVKLTPGQSYRNGGLYVVKHRGSNPPFKVIEGNFDITEIGDRRMKTVHVEMGGDLEII